MSPQVVRPFELLARHAILVSIVALGIVFSLLEDSFLTLRNFSTLVDQSAIFATLAVGATFGIISRNIDIAPASVITLADVVAALAFRASFGFGLSMAAGVGATMAIYLAHGALVGWLGLDPLIVTLAAWIWARGLAISLTNATTIPFHHPYVEFMNAPIVFGLDPSVFVAVAAFLLGGLVLRNTRTGIRAYALGQDSKHLLQAGVSPARAKLAIFAVMGVTTAIGMALMIARIGAAAPTSGYGLELDAIVAVIIGGTSFKGGSGRMRNSLYGVAFIAVLNNGLSGLQMGDPEFLLLKGLAIIAALLFDAISQRLLAR
jgi:ribose/xylose/arabinose/galactoside ABC-type transport system permease subunit